MKKKLPKLKFEIVDGLAVALIQVTEEVLSHEYNQDKALSAGWYKYNEAPCTGGCPPADLHGYYQCISGHCVYFPY